MANFNMFMPQQPTQNQIMLVPVQGEGGAQMYPVAAGSTVALIDFDAGTFWLKTTAPNGWPQQMRKFDFKEIVQAAPTNENAVTREEFASLQEKMQKILDALGEGKDK
jgi:hypothetical protein